MAWPVLLGKLIGPVAGAIGKWQDRRRAVAEAKHEVTIECIKAAAAKLVQTVVDAMDEQSMPLQVADAAEIEERFKAMGKNPSGRKK